ncbi:MAG: 1-deoxy-D-xylulose-5-phosphate reductoisomerase [Actinomycetota bacterium]
MLGSTGSIGTQTLDVISRIPERFDVHALAANSDAALVIEQGKRFSPDRIAMADADAAAQVRDALPGVDVLVGAHGVVEIARDTDAEVVVNSVVGAAGLEATLASLDAGIFVALANKESCITGGPLVRKRLLEGAKLVPVDSEHASTHMCLLGEDMAHVRELVLTASGGPFRGRMRSDLAEVTAVEALRHPTWAMGPKITIDSATLMNKGLEVLEANVLFGLGFDQIGVVCHPQSVIHCLVGFTDGSWKASLSPPDMRVPIAYAIGFPDRPDWGSEPVDWSTMSDLTFDAIDGDAFGCVALAYRAGIAGGAAPAVLNAANEEAVGAFLEGRLSFLGIAEVVERTLDAADDAGLAFGTDDLDVPEVLRADAWARSHAGALVAE